MQDDKQDEEYAPIELTSELVRVKIGNPDRQGRLKMSLS